MFTSHIFLIIKVNNAAVVDSYDDTCWTPMYGGDSDPATAFADSDVSLRTPVTGIYVEYAHFGIYS